ncbi:hypothetical protein B0J13DRAFT_618519 [Dactylonectria estremocensis]|uniref:Uncharacterized protein n=1 Tax=Dactylonectria estremocensis TaxID=1079267 RepID=A0A9P9F599_9HYPO|nr:hypothetical protein B0J13DRAFT_618519 [Dactylonectria estremocensis]
MAEQGAAAAAADEARAAAGHQRDKALPLALPPLEEDKNGGSGRDNSGSGDDSGRGDGVTTLRVGESIRLDAMGPLVVNADGSMARVANWTGMTDGEREATLRLLGRRNKQRLEALKAKRDVKGEKGAASNGKE